MARAVLVAPLLAWLAACDLAPLPPPHGMPSAELGERGRRLLAQYQCGSCHAIPGVEAARGQDGPSLEAFGRRSYIAGHVPNAPAALARWVVAPQALSPATRMPAMGVAPEDAAAMAAYLLALH